ncbi:MAG: ABC transporter ATP-binding protein [Candidatus Moranbacteria bacterium]|nr:ABC transporter ATP-binding protein [Candidatus Moranbacteria bacterium]
MKNIISLKKIHKGYQLGKTFVPIIKGVDVEIKSGEFVVLMGPSGSGKTTLLNVLGCLDTPEEGDYFLDNNNVANLDEDELASIRNKYLGFVFQSFNLIPDLTVLENVSLPSFYAGNESIPKAKEILKKIGLEKRLHHRPNELSGGQKQRVAIARALINDPEVILADEPTGNLDSKSGQEVMAIFKELNESGKTIILVTHDDYTASFASRRINLKDGLIA